MRRMEQNLAKWLFQGHMANKYWKYSLISDDLTPSLILKFFNITLRWPVSVPAAHPHPLAPPLAAGVQREENSLAWVGFIHFHIPIAQHGAQWVPGARYGEHYKR